MQWEMVLGLEVHIQLNTKTKLFCSCKTSFGEDPNVNTCPVCQAHPGALPVLNKTVLEKAILAGLATNCTINNYSRFDRKNYFYPDLPKAYQISQFEFPICSKGSIEITVPKADGTTYTKNIGITRIHIEEDAGKLVHSDNPSKPESYVDLNRAGTPLCEVVSEPELSSPEEVVAYLQTLRNLIIYAGVSDCNMEEGSFRCDTNISIRPKGESKLGNRTEIKNMNSYRKIVDAIEYEFKRQRKVLEEGGTIVTETLLFDTETGKTRSMRSKEEAHDYRYFPDPDLLPVNVSKSLIDSLASQMPELPHVKKERYKKDYSLSDEEIQTLVSDRHLANYFEEALTKCPGSHKKLSSWIITEILSILNAKQIEITQFSVPATYTGELIELIAQSTISGKIAKEIFPDMCDSGKSATDVLKEKGISMVSDDSALRTIISRLIGENPKVVADYKSGNAKAAGFIVGQLMKETKGQANPAVVNKLLFSMLDELA